MAKVFTSHPVNDFTCQAGDRKYRFLFGIDREYFQGVVNINRRTMGGVVNLANMVRRLLSSPKVP